LGRIEDLAERYLNHISTPWARTVSGAERVIMIVYDKELERVLRARRSQFAQQTYGAQHGWMEVDLTDAFATWMAQDEYRDAYFARAGDLALRLKDEFPTFVADRIRAVLNSPEADDQAVVALFGVGALFGFTHLSRVISMVEPEIRGRLAVFFPGTRDGKVYRLLDARESSDYLATPITLQDEGGPL
jgi:hypothetical protein